MPESLHIVLVCAPSDSFAKPRKSPLRVRRTVIPGQSQRTRGLASRHPQGTHTLSTGCSFPRALQCLHQRTILYPRRLRPTRYWVEARYRIQKERIAQAPFAGFSRCLNPQIHANPGLAWANTMAHRTALPTARSEADASRRPTTICSRRGSYARLDCCARTALLLCPSCALLQHPAPGSVAACATVVKRLPQSVHGPWHPPPPSRRAEA